MHVSFFIAAATFFVAFACEKKFCLPNWRRRKGGYETTCGGFNFEGHRAHGVEYKGGVVRTRRIPGQVSATRERRVERKNTNVWGLCCLKFRNRWRLFVAWQNMFVMNWTSWKKHIRLPLWQIWSRVGKTTKLHDPYSLFEFGFCLANRCNQ